MSFGKFSFSIKKYLEDAGGNENSVPEVPQSFEKKEPPSSKPEKNFSNNLNPGYISLQSAKTQNPAPYQDKGSKGTETYARITPEPSILKYFSASPNNAGPSSMFDIGEHHEKENAKDQKRKYTKKSAKDPAEKPEPKKTQKAGAKGGTKKTKSTIEAENDLHNLGELSFGMREEDQVLGKKPEKLDPVIEPPKIVVAADLSRPVIPSLKDKQKPYEFANLNYWTNNEFPWSKRLLPVMDHFFGYRVFRSNQKAIVNATLSKRDVFVCMPTGGGKSLTFQLPAIIDKGVTIVVMPLLALIYDQVTQMEQKNISVLNLSGGAGAFSAREYNSLLQIYREHQRTMDSWNYTQEMPYPKMIFITPEKIVQSEITMNFLRSLYQLGLLERIVIDEAHCVSQWGRDFRKDYLNLKKLKEEFPSVCVLALTATATEEIKIDIVEQLKMKNVLYFQNSFNRKNLIFEVRQKGKEAIRDVATFIEEYYPRKCGIIFTATTKEAEQVAQNLRQKHKIKAGFYHGQMSEASRIETQDKWMNDEIHVIVATIAFGMGINKLDVRYVIHFSFSKSISNYYQEAGRAGRDGQKAHCVIFYRYMDKKILEFLNFHNKESSKEMKKENNWELMNIIKYCEDVFSCRRAMLLSYFGERFNKEECAKTCDNCRAGKVALVKDFTEEAKIAVNFVQSREDFDYTMNQLVQVLSGRLRDKNKTKFARETQIGLLKKLKLNEVEVLVKELVIKRFFSEILKKQRGMMSDYLCILKVDKKRAALLLQGKEKVLVAFPTLKRMESNEAKAEKAKPEKAHVEKADTGVSASQKVITGNQPTQRIYMRQKSDENTVSSLAQKKTIDLASYAFKKPTSPEDFAKDDKKKFFYTKEYGFCTADQFEDIVDRLKIVRKRIFNEVKQNGGGTFQNTNNLDAIIPIEGLYDLCRKLPVSVEDLNTKNIKNIGSKQLQEHGSKFLDEIQHFVKVYQINKNEFIFPKELDEEENREIFDIQDHLAQSNRDMEAVNEWDFGIFDEETRLPSVSKSGNRTDVTDSDRENRGFNPEIEFNVRDFGEMAEEETWRNLEDGEDEEFDERDLDEMAHNERQHGHNQAQGGFEERKFEENLNGENGGSDYDDDELFWIEAALKKDQKNSEDIEPPVRKEEPLSRTSTREYNATTYNPAPSIIDNNNSHNKGGSFFDLQKNEAESKPGYISMKAAPVKRDRDSGDRFEATLPKNLKKMKFV